MTRARRAAARLGRAAGLGCLATLIACGGGESGSGTAGAPEPPADPEPSTAAPHAAPHAAPQPDPEPTASDPTPEPPREAPKPPVVVDLESHFPGLIEAFDSDRAEDYGMELLTELGNLHGQRLAAGELEEHQARWEEARGGVGDVAESSGPQPPSASELSRIESRLRQREYFSTRLTETAGEFERILDYPPFVIYVQDGVEGAARDSLSTYGERMQALAAMFAAEYAEPLGVERRRAYGPYVLFVLDGDSEYDVYKGASGADLRHARAHYEPGSRVAVTYLASRQRIDDENLHAALHEMVHAMQHAHSTRVGEQMPQATWFNEGLAEYLAYAEQFRVRTPEQRAQERFETIRYMMARTVGRVGADQTLSACIMPLSELCKIGEYDLAHTRFNQRANSFGHEGALSKGIALEFLYGLSFLYMDFLHLHEDGRYRENVADVARRMLAGEYGGEAYEAAFEGVDEDAMQEEFLDYLESNGANRSVLEDVRDTW